MSGSHLRRDTSWWQWILSVLGTLRDTVTLRRWRCRHRASRTQEPASLTGFAQSSPESPEELAKREAIRRMARRQAFLSAIRGNPALLLGIPLGLLLLALVVAGPSVAPHNAYLLSPNFTIDGKMVVPPLAPNATFPLGTDAQGRDVLSLILVGARRTLTMALFAVLVRLLIGGVLGFLAGWFQDSRLDRAIMGMSDTLAAFPTLLFAMILIYAAGVRQGLIAFVVALSLVGWTEVMQTVRAQVMRIKPMTYIEGARATGAGEGQILSAHVLPNIWPTMVSLAFLEMGGVLMLLGELCFLGVFIGGGIAAEGDALPSRIYYDIPEWSVMLASSWKSFRSVPWATIWPALAFFFSILTFTLVGEGFRLFSERLTLSLRTLFSKWTLLLLVLIIVGARLMLNSTGYAAQQRELARGYDPRRALQDIAYLTEPRLEGRLSGSPSASRTAEWIAQQYSNLGLQPAGQDNTYIQTLRASYRDLAGLPKLVLRSQNTVFEAEYGIDFA